MVIQFLLQCLKLSQGSLGQTTIGQMVNIMSNDVNRFDMSVLFLHYLWVGPLQALITTVILMFVIGPSCLVGLAILILFAPLQSTYNYSWETYFLDFDPRQLNEQTNESGP